MSVSKISLFVSLESSIEMPRNEALVPSHAWLLSLSQVLLFLPAVTQVRDKTKAEVSNLLFPRHRLSFSSLLLHGAVCPWCPGKIGLCVRMDSVVGVWGLKPSGVNLENDWINHGGSAFGAHYHNIDIIHTLFLAYFYIEQGPVAILKKFETHAPG